MNKLSVETELFIILFKLAQFGLDLIEGKLHCLFCFQTNAVEMGFTTTVKDHSQSAPMETPTFNLVRQAVVTLENTGKHDFDLVILPPSPIPCLQKHMKKKIIWPTRDSRGVGIEVPPESVNEVIDAQPEISGQHA